MNAEKSANFVRAKARKRLLSPPPEYFGVPDYNKPARRLIYEDCLTGQRHEFTLFISPSRIDQFRVEINGKPWKERVGWSNILVGLRKAAGRFSQMR